MVNKKLLYLFAVVIVMFATILMVLIFFNPPEPPEPSEQTIEGKITAISVAQNTVTILKTDKTPATINVATETNILDKFDKPVNFPYLRSGYTIRSTIITSGSTSTTSKIKVIDEPNIIVFSPVSGDEVGLPLVIKGEARVFENTVNYRVLDSNGDILMENFTTALSPDIGLYGTFETSDTYPEPKGVSGIVEVFDYSAKDGSEIDKVTIPVKFKKVESLKVKAYFGNINLNPNTIDCGKIFSVTRRIPLTQAVVRAALEEMLKGPTSMEQQSAYYTSINPVVKIQKLTIENKTAKVDFDETLERVVGGSCRVIAIRSQINETLKQFSTITNVVISINGRTEDILQP